MKTFVFPFTAVVGQEQAKKALCIALVNPLTGGLLLSGSSGTAKSVLVRAAGQFTPVGQVVELPLSATEDMIFGSVDVEVAMRSGKRRLREGLLYRAEGRILYMDEVNLLRPDFLLAVLDSQQNGFFSLQREGMDICRSVSYIPVATMNPTEGTLEPAVLDRFGMFVSFDDEKSVSMRKEIICRVLSFEKNPQGFFKKYMQEQRQLQTNVERAKKILPQIELSLPMMQLAARICMQAFCQGNRAELYLIEAARALAALAQRTYVLPQDIEAAALYVLPHRMGSCNKQGLNPPERTPEQQNDLPDRDGDMETETEFSGEDPGCGSREDMQDAGRDLTTDMQTQEALEEKETTAMAGDEKEKCVTAQENINVPALVLAADKRRQQSGGSGKRNISRSDSCQGRYVRTEIRQGEQQKTDIAFAATLRAAAPYQIMRRKTMDGPAVILRPEDWRNWVREKRRGANLLFVVDASGSMAARERMRTVKGVILSLLKEAYQKRDQVGLIAFRRTQAEVLLPVTRSIELAQKLLQKMPTGGKTPLAAGLSCALQVISGLKRRDKQQQTVIILITDGRTNSSEGQENPVDRAMEIAGRFQAAGPDVLVIDTETDFVKLGIAKQLAAVMGGNYYKLQQLSQQKILQIIRSVRA